MFRYQNMYDISVTLGEESIDYPGDTAFRRELSSRLEDGEAYDLSSLELSAHSGTHIDAPAHFVPGGKTIDQYEVGDFVFSALVVNIDDRQCVKASSVEKANIRPGEAVLFRTENSVSGRCRSGVFSQRYVHLSPEAAAACVAKGVALVGIDYVSIEKYEDLNFPAHRMLLSAGVLVLEGIDLVCVPPGRFTLFCFPLKTRGAEASPTRAVLAR